MSKRDYQKEYWDKVHVVLGTIALTAVGALLGAGIDFFQMRSRKNK